jgi:superfamily II DNA or RNA helicase
MNLEFTDVETIEHNGVPCILRRADVTKSTDFWRNWRSAASSIKKLVYLKPDGRLWYAYLIKPVGKADYVPFNFSYQVQNRAKLLAYQPEAVSLLTQAIISHGAAADGSDTGIGKTYQALAVCREMDLSPLIICKKAGFSAWGKACRYMGVTPRLILNWEAARTCKIGLIHKGKPTPFIERRPKLILGRASNHYEYQWFVPDRTLLIFDEAHLGFNPDSHNYAMWTASTGHASISMSATFADRPSRLRGLFRVLRIMQEQEFDNWLKGRGHFVNAYNELESLSAQDDMTVINKILYPEHGCRVSYNDPAVKNLFPERVIQTEIVDLGRTITATQNREYAQLIVKAEKLREMGKQAALLVADLRYRQFAELLKVPVLVEMVREYLYEGKSVAVFVNFKETLKYLAENLKTRSLIFGAQETRGIIREEVVENFQSGAERVILCMVVAGGQSLSLHDLHGKNQRVSLICPTYDPVVLQQVLGRTYRAGTKTTPIMKLVYAAGTVEEKVADVVNKKLDNIAALNDGDLMEPDLFNLGVKHEDEERD